MSGFTNIFLFSCNNSPAKSVGWFISRLKELYVFAGNDIMSQTRQQKRQKVPKKIKNTKRENLCVFILLP